MAALKENLNTNEVYIYLNLPYGHPKRPVIKNIGDSRLQLMVEASMEMEERKMTKSTYEKYLSEVVGKTIMTEEYEKEFGFLSKIDGGRQE